MTIGLLEIADASSNSSPTMSMVRYQSSRTRVNLMSGLVPQERQTQYPASSTPHCWHVIRPLRSIFHFFPWQE
jgi:hypothetical protein